MMRKRTAVLSVVSQEEGRKEGGGEGEKGREMSVGRGANGICTKG